MPGGRGRSRVSGVTFLHSKTCGRIAAPPPPPPASGFKVGDQRRGQGTASRRDSCGAGRGGGAGKQKWRPGWEPGKQAEGRSPHTAERGGVGHVARSRLSGGPCPAQRDATAQVPLGNPLCCSYVPHPLTLPVPSEAERRNPTSGPCPGPSLPAWPRVEQRTGSEILRSVSSRPGLV